MTDKSRDLVKQLLLAKRSYVVGGHTKHEWVNPDGPIAADLIETQAREIERLREALGKVAAECWVTAGTDAQMYSRWRKLAVERVDVARAALEGKQ